MRYLRTNLAAFVATAVISCAIVFTVNTTGCASEGRLDSHVANLEAIRDDPSVSQASRDEAARNLSLIQARLQKADARASEETGILSAALGATGVGAVAIPFVGPALRWYRRAQVAEQIVASLDDTRATNPEFDAAFDKVKGQIVARQGASVTAEVHAIKAKTKTKRAKAHQKALNNLTA